MTEAQVAARALGCRQEELRYYSPIRGTVYDDGASDWTQTFYDPADGCEVTIFTYAHDPRPRAGKVVTLMGVG